MFDRFRSLFPYLRHYRWLYLVGAVCLIGSVTLKMLIPHLLGGSIDELRGLAAGGESEQPPADVRGLILTAALMMVGAALLGAVARTSSRLLILGNARRVVHDLRRDVFAHLLRLSPQFYVRHQTGHVMSRCVNDMQSVQGLTGPVFLYLVETAVLYAVGLTFMLQADPWLTLVGLMPFPLFLWAARRMAGRIQEGTREGQEKLAELSAKIDESLSGHKVIKSLALSQHDRQRFVQRCGDYRRVLLQTARWRATLVPMMSFLAALCAGLVLAFGAPRVIAGDITLGNLVEMMLYLGMVAAPTATLGFVISSVQRGAAALARIDEIAAMPVTITDRSGEPTGEPVIRDGEIVVRDLTVTFRPFSQEAHLAGSLPPGAEDPEHPMNQSRTVLREVSFTVPDRSTLGIVGATGSGKTALLRALSRQLEVEPGHVFLGGADITEVPLAELRSTVGVVPQETFLFSATLADNVALGRPAASREDIERAVGVARLSDDLDQLPRGLETMLGERGVNLSGGQRQRTALARVALMRPRLLLLDDTMSAVDTHTAEAILESMAPLMREATTVIVAHRLSTLRFCDQILVLDSGEIGERGTHEELLANNGLYAALWQQQSRQAAEAERAAELRRSLESLPHGRGAR